MSGFESPGFRMLDNFYESVQFQNPAMAYLMHADLMKVAIGGMSGNRVPVYDSVIRLMDRAEGLPIAYTKILKHALQELGYSIDHVTESRQ